MTVTKFLTYAAFDWSAIMEGLDHLLKQAKSKSLGEF
jgi:hypothetical protein